MPLKRLAISGDWSAHPLFENPKGGYLVYTDELKKELEAGLSMREILGNLCYKDPRNPLFETIYGWMMDDPEEETPTPRENCACDNCFYGRDALAQEIIRLKSLLDEGSTPEDPVPPVLPG